MRLLKIPGDSALFETFKVRYRLRAFIFPFWAKVFAPARRLVYNAPHVETITAAGAAGLR